MCIIIACPIGKELDRHILYNCWSNNDDGAGMMYVRNKRIIAVKELSDFNRYYNLYRKHIEIAKDNKSPVILHFRIATHGPVCIENTHPFVIDETAAFMHNGVIHISTSGKRSDTRQFNLDYLRKLPRGFYKNKAIRALLEHKLAGNKIVILDVDANVYILNASLGEQDKETGIWYSNSSFKCDRSTHAAGWYGLSTEEVEDVHHGGEGTVGPTTTEAVDSNCLFCQKELDKKDDYYELGSGTKLCIKCAVGLKEFDVIDDDVDTETKKKRKSKEKVA